MLTVPAAAAPHSIASSNRAVSCSHSEAQLLSDWSLKPLPGARSERTLRGHQMPARLLADQTARGLDTVKGFQTLAKGFHVRRIYAPPFTGQQGKQASNSWIR